MLLLVCFVSLVVALQLRPWIRARQGQARQGRHRTSTVFLLVCFVALVVALQLRPWIRARARIRNIRALFLLFSLLFI